MKPEQTLLVWAVVLAFAQMLVAVQGTMNQIGLARLFGNREGLPEIAGWAGRAVRAHRNMLENLVLFAALVLVADDAARFNSMTALGAQLFFWARLAYALIYLAGIPYLRTAAWAVSAVGMILIALQLL